MFFTYLITALIAFTCSLIFLDSGILGFGLIILVGTFFLIFNASKKNNNLIPLLWLTIPVATLPLQITDMGGNKFNQLFMGLLMVFGIKILIEKKELLTDFFGRHKFLVILIAYTLISMSWSHYRSISMRRFIMLIGSIEMALIVSLQKDRFKNFVHLIFYFILIFSLLSIVAVVLFPRYGISAEYAGAWKGITSHKNTLGATSGISIVFFICTYHCFKEWYMKLFMNGLILLNMLFLIESRSATALILTMTITMFAAILRLFKNQKKFILVYGVGGLITTVFTVRLMEIFVLKRTFFETFVASFNKSTNLTGRTDIWPIMFGSIKQHLMLGCGYESFWIGAQSIHDPSSPAFRICQIYGQYLYEAHDGYIDVVNELGLLGLAILFAFLINLMGRIFSYWELAYDQFFLYINLLFFIIICNFVETSFMRSSSYYWLLILFIYFLSGKPLQPKGGKLV